MKFVGELSLKLDNRERIGPESVNTVQSYFIRWAIPIYKQSPPEITSMMGYPVTFRKLGGLSIKYGLMSNLVDCSCALLALYRNVIN